MYNGNRKLMQAAFGGMAAACVVALVWAGSGDAASYDGGRTIGPTEGWLIINGGHGTTPDVVSRFVELAGGDKARFVVIPTAGKGKIDPQSELAKFCDQFGVPSSRVFVLHTRNRNVANSPEFVQPIKNCTAVWFPGGRQWRLADAYLDTRVEDEIKALLARGGVVGGGSAGASIQGSFLVRGSRQGNEIMVDPNCKRGFALLPDVAIDQHVDARNRVGDLDPVIAEHPELLGIGLDQETAICVHGDQFRVMGASRVVIHDGKRHDGLPYYFLKAGDTFNLRTRTSP